MLPGGRDIERRLWGWVLGMVGIVAWRVGPPRYPPRLWFVCDECVVCEWRAKNVSMCVYVCVECVNVWGVCRCVWVEGCVCRCAWVEGCGCGECGMVDMCVGGGHEQ